jgi:predicted DNA-binding transcriptional regulator AlpA
MSTQLSLPSAAEFTNRLFLNVEDLSRALGRSRKTIARMVERGQLPPQRKIKKTRGWRLRDLLSWLELARQIEWKERHPTLLQLQRQSERAVKAVRGPLFQK